MADRIADIWGERTAHRKGAVWPARVDLHLEPGVGEADVDRWVQSACLLCSNGCGCDIAVKDGRMVGVRGRATDVVNHGRLGPKGLYGSTPWASSPDRLTRPLAREGGRLVETDWDTAMGRVVEVSQRLLADKGPLSLGFYTTGQIFIEEYYTLGVIGKAGLGTPHMDGNTRLCTATSAAAFKESFGADGQPGSYTDIEHCDAVFLYGHNMAETQTVLWMRILDRTRGQDPPKIVCVDPRRTPVAQEAERTGGVHLAPQVGTNLALMNGLTRELFVHGWVDEDWVAAHTLGRDELWAAVEPYTPEEVGRICGVEPEDVRRAARIFGESESVLSTVLQGFYQSHQATASSVAVHNLHLLRGMIGRPGAGILQMNGQPTAQNNRECGADGDLPGFRNWDNPAHVQELADLWNVDAAIIPHWSPPTNAMQIFGYAEEGSIGMLWISATNPAVSMPESARIRRILEGEQCFVVVQDLFLTETAQLADVVLPAAGWGEKTGTFTNVNRTVHLSDQAVDPPGDAKSDLDIFLMYADAMDFRDRDGAPLISWRTPEQAFEAWKLASAGRPVDYTGLSYDKLRGPTGIPWPVNDAAPEGTDRLYTDPVFPTATDQCETYGHDLLTGATVTEQEHRAMAPAGRAFLKGCAWTPAHEEPSADYPLLYTTGRTVYQFHTRTKTGRARSLHDAAPDAWVEISPPDAARHGIAEGDVVRVESPRGAIEVQARIGQVREGAVFAPFHYGSWDLDALYPAASSAGQRTDHDRLGPGVQAAVLQDRGLPDQQGPRRRRPLARAHHGRIRAGTRPGTRPGHRWWAADVQHRRGHPPLPKRPGTGDVAPGPDRDDRRAVLMPHLATYVALLHRSEQTLADAFRTVGEGHAKHPDVLLTCQALAKMSDDHVRRLAPISDRYGEQQRGDDIHEPERLHADGLAEVRTGPVGLLRDLQDLYVLAALVQTTWTVVDQGAQGLRDEQLHQAAQAAGADTARQLSWLNTRMKAAAPQALIVAT